MRRLVLAIALGIATTIAVAWAFAPHYGRGGITSKGLFLWNGDLGGGCLLCHYRWTGSLEIQILAGSVHMPESGPMHGEPADLVPAWALDLVPPRSEWGTDTYVNRRIEARGWPLPALWTAFEAIPSTGYWPYEPTSGIVLSRTWNGLGTEFPGVMLMPLTLPVRPVWSGFLADSAIYSAFWAALLLGMPALHRAHRRARGGCISCGYDLGACTPGTPCPECGRAAGAGAMS